jgi:MFS family permease
MQQAISLPSTANRWPLYGLFTANAISLIGGQLTAVAIPWFVLATTGSAAKTGLTAFVEIVPMVLASFFGGALVDRLGYRRASILGDQCSGAAVALIPTLHHTVGIAFWQLLVLVFIASFCNVPGATARAALVPDLAAAAGMPIEQATSGIQAIGRGARLLGAPLAGLMIAALGASAPLWIDAATFFVSAALIAALVPRPAPAAPAQTGETPVRGGYFAELREGLRFIGGDRVIRAIVIAVMITNLLDAFSIVLLPVFAKTLYGTALSLGLMLGLHGGGSVVGALAYAAFGRKLPRRGVFVWAFIVAALAMFPLIFFPPLAVVLATKVVGGLASGPLNPILSAVQYERIPANLRGRVLGTVTAGVMVGTPLGVLLSGLLIDQVGLRPVLIGVAAAYLFVTLSFLVAPAFREMDPPTRV